MTLIHARIEELRKQLAIVLRCREGTMGQLEQKARLGGMLSRAPEVLDRVIDDDVEIRAFRIRGSRVHGHAPGEHGDDSGEWRVYYSEEPTFWPVKVVRAPSLEKAAKLARVLASLYDPPKEDVPREDGLSSPTTAKGD